MMQGLEVERSAQENRTEDLCRQIEVLYTPGHTSGSVTFFDKDRHYGFSGDAFGSTNLLLFTNSFSFPVCSLLPLLPQAKNRAKPANHRKTAILRIVTLFFLKREAALLCPDLAAPFHPRTIRVQN